MTRATRSSPSPSRHPRVVTGRWRRILVLFGAALLATCTRAADGSGAVPDANKDFLPFVQMAPFVVEGEQLSISIHARTKADRRYAERFAEEVIAIAYDTLDGSTGAGLLIIGRKGEPHPVFVFRKFLALAEAGKLDPTVAAAGRELTESMQEWQDAFRGDGDQADDAFKPDFETVVEALPLPLEGLGSMLYQLAWTEEFDDARVTQALQSLTTADLANDRLSTYDWVFYLPPRSALGRVLKEVVPALLEQQQAGFFKRVALRSTLLVFRPTLKSAMEAVRKGLLFMTVLRAQSEYSRDDIMALTSAYTKVLMPDFKINGGSVHARAVEAIEAQKIANAEYARDPFVSPARLTEFDPAAFERFEGDYAEEKETTHRFRREGATFTWQYLDWTPGEFFPAGDRLFVSEKGDMTIEFLVGDDGTTITGVEERWERRRKTISRQSTRD